jgi:hypothetical protein
MSGDSVPSPRYTFWQSLAVAIGLGTRALEEVRALRATPPSARFPSVKLWAEGVHYAGDVVAHVGSTWQALRDTAREPPNDDDWLLIAGAGRDANTFTIRGTWLADQTYRALDVVALGGASFAARRDDPGPCPGEGWQMMARQGKPGERGERGQRGERGERGAAAAAPVALELDKEGLFTLRLADGTALTCDLYPVLSRVAR